MSDKKTVVVMDLNNALHRYYHVLSPKLMNGQRVETARSVMSLIKNIQRGEFFQAPDKMVVAADHKDVTFRHLICPTYKSSRDPHDEAMLRQEDLLHQAIAAYGIPLVKKSGVEADDSMGMIASYYCEKGFDVVIVTTDKDMYQLLNDKVRIWNPQKKLFIDEATCIQELGITPSQVPEYFALCGQSKDDIEGLYKVGKKTASGWISKYGSILNLIKHSDEIKGVVGKSLQEGFVKISQNLLLTKVVNHAGLLTEEEVNTLDSHRPNPEACKMISSLYGIKLDDTVETAADLPPVPPIEAYVDDYYANEFRF